MPDQPRPVDQNTLAPLPICCDLDGTLINSDCLVEGLVGALHDGGLLLRLPRLLVSGKARLKAEIARRVPLDVSLLPFNEDVLSYLREKKEAGHYLVLATASDRSLAEAICLHLEGLFDDVIASDGTRNLRGRAKTEALVERFGEHGFSYIGNDHTDLEVWRRAASGVLVNVSGSVARGAVKVTDVERTISQKPSWLRPAIKEIRPYQWVKNALVFVPILTSGAALDFIAWGQAALVFVAFCLVASSIYVCNDLFDLSADRNHPRKRKRPFASGDLPLVAGLVLAPSLFVCGMGFALASGAAPLVLGYAATSIAYSIKLKEMPLVDVFLLAALYTIRLFAGGVATGYEITIWMFAFSCFLFLSLGIMKRVAELAALDPDKATSTGRRGYMAADKEILKSFGAGATFASAMVMALYVQSDRVAEVYTVPTVLLWLVPLVLFWQCRLWLATARGYMDDDPIVYAAKDWVSALVGVGLALTVLIAQLLPPTG